MKKLLLGLFGAGALASIVALNWAYAAIAPQTLVGNANYTMLSSDITLIPTVALTTNRTWTLPYAGAYNPNRSLDIIDAQGNVGGANSCIVIAPQSGDTINGSSNSVTFCATYGKISIFPMSGTNWVTFSPAAGQYPGTTTNDNAQAGNVGEFITAAKTLATARQNTTNSSITLVSVALTPGDWDCRGIVSSALSNTTTMTQLSASISGTDGVLGTQGTEGTTEIVPVSAGDAGNDLRVGPARQSLSGNTTIYLVAGATFATSTLWNFGTLSCRRVR